jgi:hypothetical protein
MTLKLNYRRLDSIKASQEIDLFFLADQSGILAINLIKEERNSAYL